jgi:hypothetical protein
MFSFHLFSFFDKNNALFQNLKKIAARTLDISGSEVLSDISGSEDLCAILHSLSVCKVTSDCVSSTISTSSQLSFLDSEIRR